MVVMSVKNQDNFTRFASIFQYYHWFFNIDIQIQEMIFHKFTNWQAMHLSDKCADLLVGSCSQSLQPSDFHLLIYAPLRGAEYLSPKARNKKVSSTPQPPDPHSWGN
jgi:hypothetical protein